MKILGGLLISVAFVTAMPAQAQPAQKVVQAELDGVVEPFAASYIEETLKDAAREGAAAVLLTIDTPGGLESSTRKIVKSVLASKVPVICYVSPQGARAASAGTFVLMGCPIAAMAPGTNVGAAHPVGVSGAVENEKAINDAVAFIRSLAERYQRNADWAEKAVRSSESVSASEALRLGVIDIVSSNDVDLLSRLDGKVVDVGGKQVALELSNATVVKSPLGIGARILHSLFSPNLSFIFFYAGLILIVVELLHPGLSVPGVLGLLMVTIAFASFGMLAVELLGVVLLIASVGFFLLELKVPGVGLATAGGLASLVIGGLLLFDRSVPNSTVSPGVIVPVAVASGLFFAFVVQAAMKARHLPVTQRVDRLVGVEGYATTDLDPSGIVHVSSETFSADSEVPISKGERVVVTGVDGLKLKVRSTKQSISTDSAEGRGKETV